MTLCAPPEQFHRHLECVRGYAFGRCEACTVRVQRSGLWQQRRRGVHCRRYAQSAIDPYASDKLASEYYLDFYQRQHGVEPVVFRFFNIYGPRQDPSSPYSGVISILPKGRKSLPVSVFGDGEQTRDFVFVSDLIKLLMRGLERPGAVTVQST